MFDPWVKCFDSDAKWTPVSYDGTDVNPDPSGQDIMYGEVTAAKVYSGMASTCSKRYANLTQARRAAARLVEKLRQAQTAEEHNAIIDAWHQR